MIWLNRKNVEALLDAGALVSEIASGFRGLAGGDIINGHEVRIDIAAPRSSFVAFPAVFSSDNIFSVKVLTANELRTAHGLPLISALIVIVDTQTGETLAIMDGSHVTAMRTAAITAVALEAMPPQEGGILALIGTGVVARIHARILPRMHRYDRVMIASTSYASERAEEVAAEVKCHSPHTPVAIGDIETALRQAHTVVTATNRREPLAPAASFASVSRLAVVGSCLPDASEIPFELLTSSTLLADWPDRFRAQWRGALPEATLARIYDLAALTAHPERMPDGRTIFCSAGMAFADGVAALAVYRNALEQGVGQRLD